MKMCENRRKGEVVLCGKWKIDGVILEARCEICNYNLVYFYKYDAEFCPNCNEWLSGNCNDPDCCFCNKRPDTPFHEFYK